MKAELIGGKALQNKINKMTKNLNPRGFEIYFNDEEEREKAARHHFGRGVPATPFFALSKKQRKRALKEVQMAVRHRRNTRKQLYGIAGEISSEIVKRTKEGKSPSGGVQRNYSKDYLEYRTKERNRPGNPVRLYLSGDMFKAISERLVRR